MEIIPARAAASPATRTGRAAPGADPHCHRGDQGHCVKDAVLGAEDHLSQTAQIGHLKSLPVHFTGGCNVGLQRQIGYPVNWWSRGIRSSGRSGCYYGG